MDDGSVMERYGDYNNGIIRSMNAFINIVSTSVRGRQKREGSDKTEGGMIPWGGFLLHLVFDSHRCLRGSDALGMIIGGWGEGKR